MLSDIRDRLLSIQLRRDEKEVKIGFIVIGIIILFLLANVIYLNFILVDSKSVTKSNSLSSSPTPVASPIVSAVPTTQPKTSSVGSQNTVKDYFIPLGSGSNQSSDWTDVPGAQVTVDLGQYQDIKEIRLEVSVNVPTANGSVYVRLYNVTDKHPVWNSDVVGSGSSTTALVSPAVIYDNGSKSYQVQMKTQLGVLANLTQSRIHVIVK